MAFGKFGSGKSKKQGLHHVVKCAGGRHRKQGFKRHFGKQRVAQGPRIQLSTMASVVSGAATKDPIMSFKSTLKRRRDQTCNYGF